MLTHRNEGEQLTEDPERTVENLNLALPRQVHPRKEGELRNLVPSGQVQRMEQEARFGPR